MQGSRVQEGAKAGGGYVYCNPHAPLLPAVVKANVAALAQGKKLPAAARKGGERALRSAKKARAGNG